MNTEIFLQILILGASLYLIFFKSYLTEKGKSVALKEDIQELTREVELVKSEFVKEQEILKADLQKTNSNETSYRNEERDALIQFYGIINEWLYSILEIGFGNYNKSNIEMLIEVRNRNSSFYAKAGVSKSKISLLVTDPELEKASSQLYTELLKFHGWADMEFLKLQQNLESHKYLTERFMIIIKDFENNKALAEDMAKDEKELTSKARELFDNYYKNRLTENAKVNGPMFAYEKLVKEYLKK